MQLSGPKHLPVRDCLAKGLYLLWKLAVIQGLHTNDTNFVSLRALRMALDDGMCHPAHLRGQLEGAACVHVRTCKSGRDRTVYCVDPFGRQNFSATVVNALSAACKGMYADSSCRFKLQVNLVALQANS